MYHIYCYYCYSDNFRKYAISLCYNSPKASIKDDNLKHYIFADESNTDKARFMLIGGVWVDELTYSQVVAECKKFKSDNGWGEKTKFNWKNISKKTLQQYFKFIDIFFKYNLQFNCIIIDRKEIDLKANENKDPELGFYKFYYQLLRKNSKSGIPYYIYLDRRNNSEPKRLETLKQFLQKDNHPINWLGFRITEKGLNIPSLKFVNSDTFDLIQMSDLLLGAIGFQYNNRHMQQDASQNKVDFANYIASKIKMKNLVFATGKNGYKNMNLWLFKSEKALLSKN